MKRLIPIFALLVAVKAHAVMTPVNTLGEGGTSSSLGLQGIIDARGNNLVSIGNDDHQIDDASDSLWTATGDLFAGIVVEVAGFAPNNAFGIYNSADPFQRMQLFGGSAAGGDTTSGVTSPFSTFGFYLENSVAGFTWYSDSSLNAGNMDHMVGYAGFGETLNLGNDANSPIGSLTWDENSFLFGWEDLSLGDADYNDMVVVLQNIQLTSLNEEVLTNVDSVPDTASTASLLALGLVGLVFVRRRRIG